MKKALICLLCAVLLSGLFACGKEKDPTAAEKTDEPTAEQTTEEPPAATNAPAFSESDSRPLTFAEDADTLWIARGTTLLLYPEGTGILTLHKNNYEQHLNITERDGTFLAEIQMYRTPFDSEPAYCFPAGELRLFTDGNAVRIKVTEDPLGIFADEDADGAILEKSDYKPYRFIFANSGNTPDQPNTEWGVHFKNGRQTFLVDENAAFYGAVRMPDGTDHACAFMSNLFAFTIVEERDGAAELLFYGRSERVGYRQCNVQMKIRPIYDPYDLCGDESLELYRDEEHLDELRYMNGQNLDTVTLRLLRDGWTDKTDELQTIARSLVGWFALFRKEGQAVLIFYELDFTPYGDEAFPIGFVQYAADGTVVEWSGVKPIDHRIADAYTVTEGSAFHDVVGWGGAIFNEDDFIYFLDDGRIAVQTVWHENRHEDDEFHIYRIIP